MTVVNASPWLNLNVWTSEAWRLISSSCSEKTRSRDLKKKPKSWGMLSVCVTRYRYEAEQREQRCWEPALTQMLELASTEWLVGGKRLSAGRTRFVLDDGQSEPPASHYLLVACRAAHFCFKSTLRLITVSAVAGRCFKCVFLPPLFWARQLI